jgi:hypothetical protein
MSSNKLRVLLLSPALASVLCASACGGGSTEQVTARVATAPKATNVGADDRSRCDFKGRPDREAIESTGPGALMPNVRRVFGIMGEGEDRRRVLFCREIDTNLDGVKDVVRTYNDKGDAVEEQADSNYDGRVDTWIRFASGRIAKVELDRNNDGIPDETRYYVKGKLSRVQRDTNYDGKPDVWEVYADGQLERMGTDLDYDGHVDRWDRDEVAHRIADERARAEEEKAQAAQKPDIPTETSNTSAGGPASGPAKPDDKSGAPAADDKGGATKSKDESGEKPAQKATDKSGKKTKRGDSAPALDSMPP